MGVGRVRVRVPYRTSHPISIRTRTGCNAQNPLIMWRCAGQKVRVKVRLSVSARMALRVTVTARELGAGAGTGAWG